MAFLKLNIDEATKSRFWKHVAKSPESPLRIEWGLRKKPETTKGFKNPTHTNCWEWQGSRDTAGYGWFKINGRAYRTHRLSWIIHYEMPIPADRLICHTCDNPPCVNIDHLWLGTVKMNLMDIALKRDKKVRKLRRDAMILKFPQEVRHTMMEDFKTGMSYIKVAKKYKTSIQHIIIMLKKYDNTQYEEAKRLRKLMPEKRSHYEHFKPRSSKVPQTDAS